MEDGDPELRVDVVIISLKKRGLRHLRLSSDGHGQPADLLTAFVPFALVFLKRLRLTRTTPSTQTIPENNKTPVALSQLFSQ